MSSVLNHARSLSGTPRRRACLLINSRLDKQNQCGVKPAVSPRNWLPSGFRSGSLRFFQSASLFNVPATLPIDIQPPRENNNDQRTPAVDPHAIVSLTSKPPTENDKAKLVTASANVRIKPKPAEYLSKALRNSGHALGHEDQLTGIDRDCPRHVTNRVKPRTIGRPKKPSLAVILGEYIREVDPVVSQLSAHAGEDLDTALKCVFRDTNNEYLTSRGYSPTDVTSWAWILTSRNPHEAAVRLFMLEADTTKPGAKGPTIPPFILLHLLRQQSIDAHTFRLLLIHSLHLMSGQPLPPHDYLAEAVESNVNLPSTNPHPSIDSGTCMVLVTRLIRHALRVWPQALLTISRAFAQYLTTPRENAALRTTMQQRHDERVKTDKFNECLWLLSLPAKVAPYRSTPIQQQAQFELLRAMATYKPVLPVTRQGYRAIVAVQLAHKKTSEERQSAELKAPSWPPWKEEKLGIDSLRGNDGMYSRAMQVLSQMADAGYSRRLWEDISSILAGWDTDHSPTVQTRAMMRCPQALPDTHTSKRNHHEIWVARIRSTRTIREAWACFLSYEDHGLPPKKAIFAAMAEKLINRRIAIERRIDSTSPALPGDGREVHAEPASARDIIYVSKEPPTLDEFLDQMLAQGFRPSGRLLGLLLQSASSVHAGLQYLLYSDLTSAQIATLTVVQAEAQDYRSIDLPSFQAVPDLVFASFIKLLCAHSNTGSSSSQHGNIPTAARFPILMDGGYSREAKVDLVSYAENHPGNYRYPRTLWHAVQLTRMRSSPYPPAWKHILSFMARGRFGGSYGPRGRSLQRILAWHQSLKLVNWMQERDIELGEDGFQTLCVAFTKAIDAGLRHPGTAEQSFLLINKARLRRLQPTEEGDNDFDTFLQHALEVLKGQFDYLVLPTSKTSEQAERSIFAAAHEPNTQPTVPSMLHTPSPATLHAFVRALGFVGDDDGLLHLLQWMSQSADLLREAADEHINGGKMMHRTLVAIRVFLERRQEQTVDSRVPSDVVQEAYDLVRRTGWDWPSDAEVEEYCR
ncbi:unnamed protein product [Penicillium salamii]|uniref:Uncharacterized protein n=1 Tax=Penicillium salamii TaxID=1612424 RepID=A0A9W4IAJ2_9EURO|nr:unnamed protein product [Penicillium salamii]CAG7990656.1 unnamed protein product [Penicillium salamii]CAG7998645.1 unnamed protein product [Penicillium salamii]CAG8251934.1 unnamed protein product [Penicillium salamii]CAG8264535.1 unnamed protein product [Penicillium salamii]